MKIDTTTAIVFKQDEEKESLEYAKELMEKGFKKTMDTNYLDNGERVIVLSKIDKVSKVAN